MNGLQRALFCVITTAALFLTGMNANAAEIATLCWMTDNGNLMRFTISQPGPTDFTYTGIFTDTDNVEFAIVGDVVLESNSLVGSFSGSKSTTSIFKTGIWRVTLDPTTLAGTVEGIVQAYDRSLLTITPGYKFHTVTLTTCP
ncbi:MAG TPA: hypothetical protein VMV33_12990 [Rhodocyclaceae bacterium]|nr:hypothetical protein [Rhodocyclaceae bacterium]